MAGAPGSDLWIPPGTSAFNVPGLVVYAVGPEIAPLVASLAGTNSKILLKGRTIASPYTINTKLIPAGTYLGGVQIEGPVLPARDTFAGVRNAGTPLTSTQLAGAAAVLKVLHGDTVNYIAGVAGHGWDKAVFRSLFLWAPTLPQAENFFFDVSAEITFDWVKHADFTGGMVKFCKRWTSIKRTGCQSSAMSAVTNLLPGLVAGGSPCTFTTPNDGLNRFYQLSGGVVSGITVSGSGVGTTLNQIVGPNVPIVVTFTGNPTLFQSTPAVYMGIFGVIDIEEDSPIDDYFNNGHFYIGCAGPLTTFTGKYGTWKWTGIADFNPSGMYPMDVAIDAELGSTAGLDGLYVEIMLTNGIKPFYTTNVYKGRIGLIDHHVPGNYGPTPYNNNNLPAAGCPAFSSAGSSGVTVGCMDLEVQTIRLTQDANSSPQAFSPHIFAWSNYTYVGKTHIGTFIAHMNGPSFATAQNGSLPSIFRLVASPTGAASQFFDSFKIDRFESSIGIAVDGSGNLVPSGKALPLYGLAAGTGAGTSTAGCFHVAKTYLRGGSGPTPSAWVPTTATPFLVAAGGEGVYQVSGAGVTDISLLRAGNAAAGQSLASTGLTAGAWHLYPGDTIQVTFTGSPTFNLYQGAAEPTTAGDGTNPLYASIISRGFGSTTFTLADEELLEVDFSELAANAVTTRRPAPVGTFVTTRRKVIAWAPADTHDTVADAVGTGTFQYTHGYDGAANALVTKGLPADCPGTLTIFAGTSSGILKNGGQISTTAVVAGKSIEVEVGDLIAIAQTVNPTSIAFAPAKRLGA